MNPADREWYASLGINVDAPARSYVHGEEPWVPHDELAEIYRNRNRLTGLDSLKPDVVESTEEEVA